MTDQPTSGRRKKLYIETVGCQMNLLDSELVVARMRNEGYELTDDLNQADAIFYNTCSVRQHAEDKIYSALGRIKRIKESQARSDDRRARAAWRRRTKIRSFGALPMWTWSSGRVSLRRCRNC